MNVLYFDELVYSCALLFIFSIFAEVGNENKDRLLVIIWGQKYWKDLLGLNYSEEKSEDYLDYIDVIHTQSHKLSRNNLRPKDFKRIVDILSN